MDTHGAFEAFIKKRIKKKSVSDIRHKNEVAIVQRCSF